MTPHRCHYARLILLIASSALAAGCGEQVLPQDPQDPCAIRAVSAGGSHTCVVLAGGGVRCWGAGAEGQLGDGAHTDRVVLPATSVLEGVRTVRAGMVHTCAVTEAGGVRCWGFGGNGRLGGGTETDSAVPPSADVLTGVQDVSLGRTHTCALMNGGGVRCWGGNERGQLGDGTTTDRMTPPTSDVLTGAIAVAAGGIHTCALMKSGGVRCWGGNTFGQLGDGTMDDMNDTVVPPDVDVISNVKMLATGDVHSCVVLNTGGIRCWGHNINGEVGIGNYDPVPSPSANDILPNASGVAAGHLFTCGVTQAGGVRCWGYNGRGQLGDATDLEVDRLQPADTDVLAGVETITVGISHTCALMKQSRGLRCWGHNGSGQLGNGLAPEYSHYPPLADLPKLGPSCP